MRLLLAAALLIAAHASYAFELSPPSVVGAVAHAEHARIASNGEGYLTVWADWRRGHTQDLAIRAMLLDEQGRPRLARDFEIAAATRPISVLWDGEPWLEVASNGREYVVAYSKRFSTTFARVTNDGTVLPALESTDGQLRSNMVAWGRYYAAVVSTWQGMKLVLVDDHGDVVANEWRIPQPGPWYSYLNLHATADGRLLMLVPGDTSKIGIAFMTLDEVFDPTFDGVRVRSHIPAIEGPAGIAELEGRFLIAQSPHKQLFLSLIDQEGAVVRTETRDAPELEENRRLHAARLGSGFVLIAPHASAGLEDGFRSLAALRLSADLTPATAAFQHLTHEAGPYGAVAIVVNGGVTLAYANNSERCCAEGFRAVRVQRLSASGEELFGSDGAVASMNLPSQEQAVVEQCGAVHFAAWIDTWSDGTQVNVRRFLSDGTPLDPPNRAIASALPDQTDLTITCGRSSVLLTWWDRSSYTRGLAFMAKRGGEVTLSILRGGDGAPVFDGEHFVIFGGRYNRPLLTRWTEQGQQLAEHEPPGMGRTVHSRALSWSGEHFYVAWQEQLTFGSRIMVRRLDRNFNAAGPDVELAPVPIDSHSYDGIHLASDDAGGALAAWGRCSTDGCVAHTARIDAGGVLRDGAGGQPRGEAIPRGYLSDLSVSRFRFALSFNGTDFELLTENGLIAISPEGRSVSRDFALPMQGRPAAITSAGDRRMLLSWRLDRQSGLKRLSAEFVDAAAWTLPPSQRQRSARH